MLQRFIDLVPPGLWEIMASYAAMTGDLISVGSADMVKLAQPVLHAWAPRVEEQLDALDAQLQRVRPWQLALAAFAAALLVATLALRLQQYWCMLQLRGGALQASFAALRRLPGVRGLLARQMARVRAEVSADLHAKGAGGHGSGPVLRALPARSMSHASVLQLLRHRQAGDICIAPGRSSMSGTVYIGDEEHKRFMDDAYSLFSWTNPLHTDVFPSVRRMEAEVIAMTASMLGGGPGTAAPAACGAMTSGGTESILLAVKAARDWCAAQRGVLEPEMVVGPSAHAAYWKAAEYFKIRLVKAPLGKDYRLSGAAVARRITRNTVLVVASAPGFPHGVVDDVEGIATAAARAGVPCHVDCCLGGFVLPFARKLGYTIPPFDFAVNGVTSISVDTHKFAQAAKGTSVILYRDPEMRRHQFTTITDWTGGLYISPSMAGSRSGGLIAAAWASLVSLGEEGLLKATAAIMRAAREFETQLLALVPELELVGRPDMCVVAFRAKPRAQLNMYALNDALSARGWHLNALQFPPALHFCFSAATTGIVEELVTDIAAAVQQLPAKGKGGGSGGSAPVYGMSGLSPDRGLLGEVLLAYQDCLLAP